MSKIKDNAILSFPAENIDTSWMTTSQRNIFDVVSKQENKNKSHIEICKLAGYKTTTCWYAALRDERFKRLLESMDVKINQVEKYADSSEVKYLKGEDRAKYLLSDTWDLRALFPKYPRHHRPSKYIVNFSEIKNDNLRKEVKRYYTVMLSNWEPLTFRSNFRNIRYFIDSMSILHPNLNSFKDLTRENVEEILGNIDCPQKSKRAAIMSTRSMFEYMYHNKWDTAPTIGIINKYDVPSSDNVLPRPIPPDIKVLLDDYLENVVIPKLEKGEPTPIMEDKYWDLTIIMRFTGRRFEDVSHLIQSNSKKKMDSLKYDTDNDPLLHIDHRIAKIPKDIRVPLSHLKNSKGRNIVEDAILRQSERVKDIPATEDGYEYLFREYKTDNRKINLEDKRVKDNDGNFIVQNVQYSKYSEDLLEKVSKEIPLTNQNGSIYTITSHQFRHTVATEMINAGVDIYAVKEFLGHSSIAMTERYIKIYQSTLKKEFELKLSSSAATDIKNNIVEDTVNYDNMWVKNKIIGVFELGDGCCEHPYKMPSCPHMVCKTCVKKKIYPRHINAVKNTIESETIHRDNAVSMGLSDKAKDFQKILDFHLKALEIIEKGEVFEAKKHFYNK